MTYLHTNNQNKKSKTLWSVIIALLFVIVFFRNKIGHVISAPVFAVSHGLIELNQRIDNWWSSSISYFKTKKGLGQENKFLKEKITELDIKDQACRKIEQEDVELKAFYSRTDINKKKYILGSILKVSPEMPYGTIIVDAGANQGVKEGMLATVYGESLVGTVAEVFRDSSKIKLTSFPSAETEVMLTGSNITTSARGKGGENLEISLPREIGVSIGEMIVTPGLNNLVVGFVDTVDSDPADPFQIVRFRIPVNLRQVRNIMIEK